MVTDQISRLRPREMLIEDAVQTARLVHVSIHAVLDALGGVAGEMVRLALHGTDACVLEEEPVVRLVVLAGALGIGDLVVWVVLLGQVLQDAAGFE